MNLHTSSAWQTVTYWQRVLGAVPNEAVLRALWRRGKRWLRGPAAAAYGIGREVGHADVRLAAVALGQRPRLFPFTCREMDAVYQAALPGAQERARQRGEAVLRHEIELFGQTAQRGDPIDWQHDPRSGLRFDAQQPAHAIDILAPGRDPKGPWELARCAHLLELGVAARLVPDLAAAAQRETVAEISSFLDDNPVGRGIHWTVPLEAALRAFHWLAALELVGNDGPDAFRRCLSRALLEHGRFIARHLEDDGLVPANHLIGNWLGLLAIGVALGSAGEATRWRRLACAGLMREAARQVLRDGASFEASTAYQRFTLELLLGGARLARAARLDCDLSLPLGRMFRCVAATLGPDGCEPGLGDSDDGRVLPLSSYPPRDQQYLLSLGAVYTGAAVLKRPDGGFSVEAAWLDGAAGWARWQALHPQPTAPLRLFIHGGWHVARSRRQHVMLRCGAYGQQGVGGHAHNDQLALSVWLDGGPLIVDPGTYCYAADPLWRDQLRGTAAHATVVIDGAEQSPIDPRRLFALPDGAHAVLEELEERGAQVRLHAQHQGYRRLPCRAVHHREIVLDRRHETLRICDRISGHGTASIRVCFPLGTAISRRATGRELARLAQRSLCPMSATTAGTAAWLRHAMVLCRGQTPVALLLVLANATQPTPVAEIIPSAWAPRYGERRQGQAICLTLRANLPVAVEVLLVAMGGCA